MENIQKLKLLLAETDNLRKNLIEKIKDYSSAPYSKENIKSFIDSIETIQKEREQIFKSTKQKGQKFFDEEQKIRQREKELEKKEKILENKLKKLYKKSKEFNVENISSILSNESKAKEDLNDIEIVTNDSGETIAAEKIITQKPIEIVIKVINQSEKKPKIKLPSEMPTVIKTGDEKKAKANYDVENQTKILMPPRKNKKQYDDSSGTSYRSPPNELSTPLTHKLVEKELMKKSLKNLVSSAKGKETHDHLVKDSIPIPVKPTQNSRSKIHPKLAQYIERLINMPCIGIAALGVSSSEIETPSSSIINTNDNLRFNSSEKDSSETDSFKKAKMEQLESFMRDSYELLKKVDESLKKDASLSMSTNSSIKTIEKLWKQTLKGDRTGKIDEPSDKQIKPILKKSKTPRSIGDVNKSIPIKAVDRPSICTSEIKEPTKEETEVGKYNELTEQRAQRISHLNDMIKKVRQEKRKLLEVNLSSGGETVHTSTEYADIVFEKKDATPTVDKKYTPSPPQLHSPEKIQLEKNKLTGISRDSGISLSRPVTALDNRESPEISSLQEDYHQSIIKDIPKGKEKLPDIQIISPPILTDVKISKKDKPPASLDRFSPQLGEGLQPPHELSAIIEIDTPATSRLNASIEDKNENLAKEKVDVPKDYQKFLSFSEYIEQKNFDLTDVDKDRIYQIQNEYDEMISKLEKSKKRGERKSLLNEFQKLVESLRQINLNFQKFPSKEYLDKIEISDSKSACSASLQTDTITSDSLRKLELSFKKFLTPKEYFEQMELTDSKFLSSISNAKKSKNEDESNGGNSTESLLDVVKELRRRKMLTNSFRYSKAFGDKKSSESKISDDIISTSNSSKTNNIKDISLNEKLMHTEKSDSSDTEEELIDLGLTWAAQLLRKKYKKREEYASTSSGIHHSRSSPRKLISEELSQTIKQELSNITNDTNDDDKSFNMKEYIVMELENRLKSSKSDDSASSMFLRSLLGSSNSKISENQTLMKQQKSIDRVKTSTPQFSHPSQSTQSNNEHKFFSGDSCPSSVHCEVTTTSISSNHSASDDKKRNLSTTNNNDAQDS